MATSVPVGFNLHDFLTRIVPGFVVISPLMIGLLVIHPSWFNNVSLILLIATLGSFLIGEGIELFRVGAFRTPTPFLYLIYQETGDMEIMPWWYRFGTKMDRQLPDFLPKFVWKPDEYTYHERFDLNFRENLESKFGLEFESAEPRDIYDALLIHMEPRLTSRTRRHQSLYAFTNNLQISTVLIVVIYGSLLLLNTGNIVLSLAFISVLLFTVFIVVLSSFLEITPHLYFDLLMKEYYVSEYRKSSEN